MIEVSGISKRYGDVSALDQVSFQVERGQIVGFLGANGAGKTTTMDILCGCIGADTGSVKIFGHDITEDPIAAKSMLGYLPDEPPIHDEMTVEAFVRYVARLRKVPTSELEDRVKETLAKLSLSEMRNRRIGNLSKGYRQRVGLAQALVHNPPILILDEPTEGLDPNQIVQIRELILSLKGDHTILFSSHILSEVQSLCDQLIIIDSGRVVEAGTYESILGKFQGRKTYSLKVRQGAKALSEKFLKADGIAEVVCLNDHQITFDIDQDEGVDQLTRMVLDGNHGLLELTQKSASLEDIFHQLTQH